MDGLVAFSFSSHHKRSLLWALVSVGLSAALLYWMREASPSWQGHSFRAFGRTLEVSDTRALLLVGVIPLLLFGVGRSFADLPWQQRILSFILRAAFFCSLALGLARPEETEKSSKVCTVVLVDVSMSVGDAALEKFTDRLVQLDGARASDDELKLVGFGRDAATIDLKRDEKGRLMPPALAELRGADPGGATNIEAAVNLAAAWTRSDCLSRYLLFTDGIETRGNALSAIGMATKRGVLVHGSLLTEAPPQDVAVVDLRVPPGVRTGEPFDIRVKFSSTAASRGELRLYQGEMINGLDGVRQVELPAGGHTETFRSVVRVPGDVAYRVEFVPEAKDHLAENNHIATAIEVPGPPRILLVDRKPRQATYLAQALVSQQLDVDVRGPSAMPQSQAELNQFQFVILSDLARKNVTRGAEALLRSYVYAGGGLLFSGGEAGFGPGGWQGSSLEKILPVRMDAHKEREVPGVAMALVIDRSGSMTGLPLAMAKEACNATVGVLDGNDLLEIIAFDSRPKRFVSMQPARYSARIKNAVATILPGGGTEIFNSLDMAYQDLAAVEARKKHIILLTDGNAGSDGLYELASAAFAEGITVTTVGLGGGVNRALLSMIAESGGGRFHAAEEPSKLPRIFTRETELISKKAALDDWFPVGLVRSAAFLKGVGIGAAPLLRGYTSTQLGPAPSELILVSDRGEPILARRPVGLGWTLAWTSDMKSRWATDWLKWSQFGRFIAQLVREHQKTDDTEVRPMSVEVVGDELIATLEVFDAAENFDNTLRSSLQVRLVGGEEKKKAQEDPQAPEPILFQHVAPGLYQARTRLDAFGSYAVKAVHKRATKEGSLRAAGVSFASVSRPYPEEYRDLTPRPLILKSWAQSGSGKFEPSPKEVWDAQGHSVESKKARQNDFILLALVLFLLDLLVRRVRLFDRKFSAERLA